MQSMTTTVTSKGQVTIPKEIRDAANLKEGEKLIVNFDGRTVSMRPVIKEPLKELMKLREKISFSQAEIDQMIKDSKKAWSKF